MPDRELADPGQAWMRGDLPSGEYFAMARQGARTPAPKALASRGGDRARTQLYDTAALVEERWPGEYSAMCRDLRDLGDLIEEENGG